MSSINEIINYVMDVPGDTNPNVLRSMLSDGVSPLPSVNINDNGKILTVIDGYWDKALPGVTPDNFQYTTPEQYGAKGDGITDDTEAIQAAIDSHLPVVFGNKKTYIVLSFNLYQGCKLYGNGATFKRPNLKEEPYNYSDDDIKGLRMMQITGKQIGANTEDLQIDLKDLTFDFNGFSFWSPSLPNPYIYEQGVGIYCSGGVEHHAKILIDNCMFKNNYASNIAIANYVDLKITNCSSINCFKGLCTIIGSGGNLEINNCYCNSNYDFMAFWYEPNNSANDDYQSVNISNCIFYGGFQGITNTYGHISLSNSFIQSAYNVFAPKLNNNIELNNNKFIILGENSIDMRGNGRITINNCDFTSLLDETEQTYLGKGIEFANTTFNDYNTTVIINGCNFYNLAYAICFDHGGTQKFGVTINNCIFKNISTHVIGTVKGYSACSFKYCYITNCVFDVECYIYYASNSASAQLPVFNGGNDVINSLNQGIYEYGGNTIIFKDEMWSVPVPLVRYRTGASYKFNGIGKRVTLMEAAPSSSFIGINNVDFAQLTVSPYTKYEYVNDAWSEIT